MFEIKSFNRRNKSKFKLWKDYLYLFIKRNALELLLVGIIGGALIILSFLIMTDVKKEYQVTCKVTEFNQINMTESMMSSRRLNSVWFNQSVSESYTPSTSVSESKSESESESESVSVTYFNNTLEGILDPYWFFDYYCVFSKVDSNDHRVTNKKTAVTLIAELVVYSQSQYYIDHFAMGSDHTCIYNSGKGGLRYMSEKEQLVQERTNKTEVILFGFCIFFIIFAVYFIYDKERLVSYEQILNGSDISKYIENFNTSGGFIDNTSSYSNDTDMEIQFLNFDDKL